MTLFEKIDHDLKDAMKAKDELTLSALRLARTALKNKQIELRAGDAGRELSEAEGHAVLKTMIKQYQDALADFQTAGRQDLFERQQKEIDLLAKYLPPSMPADELEKIVREAVENSGAKEVGKAMGIAMKAVAGRADGNAVREIVQRLITG